MSFDALFATNTIAFLVSGALILSVLLPTPKPTTDAEGTWAKLTFGLRAYLATPRLRGLLAFTMAAAATSAMIIVNTVVYVQGVLSLNERDTAMLFAAFGAGSMAAALSLPRLLHKLPDRTVMTAGAVMMIAGLAAGMLLPSYGWAMALWFLLGAGYSAILLPSGRLLRRSSGEGDRPAYFAAQFALSHACWLVTYPLAGWLGNAFGLAPAFGVLCVIALGATLLGLLVWPAQDPDELEHTHDALEHEHLHVHDEHHQHEHEGWEGPEPHSHPHRHDTIRHRHAFVIDSHHPHWPVSR